MSAGTWPSRSTYDRPFFAMTSSASCACITFMWMNSSSRVTDPAVKWGARKRWRGGAELRRTKGHTFCKRRFKLALEGCELSVGAMTHEAKASDASRNQLHDWCGGVWSAVRGRAGIDRQCEMRGFGFHSHPFRWAGLACPQRPRSCRRLNTAGYKRTINGLRTICSWVQPLRRTRHLHARRELDEGLLRRCLFVIRVGASIKDDDESADQQPKPLG